MAQYSGSDYSLLDRSPESNKPFFAPNQVKLTRIFSDTPDGLEAAIVAWLADTANKYKNVVYMLKDEETFLANTWTKTHRITGSDANTMAVEFETWRVANPNYKVIRVTSIIVGDPYSSGGSGATLLIEYTEIAPYIILVFYIDRMPIVPPLPAQGSNNPVTPPPPPPSTL